MTTGTHGQDPHERREEARRWESAHRRQRFLTGVCVLLLGVVIGLVWVSYPMLRRPDASAREIPTLKDTVDTVRANAKQAEERTADASKAQAQALKDEAAKLGHDLRVHLQDAEKRASASAQAAYANLEARLDGEKKDRTKGIAELKDRVSGLEAERAADKTQIAQLSQEVHELHEQTASKSAQEENQLADLSGSLKGHPEGIERIPFEATKDRDSGLGDGIYLHVSDTDVSYGRVSGWMWLASDDRLIWLRKQGTQRPVVFYGLRDGQKRELVITNVAENSIAGYLLLPKKQAGQDTPSPASAD